MVAKKTAAKTKATRKAAAKTGIAKKAVAKTGVAKNEKQEARQPAEKNLCYALATIHGEPRSDLYLSSSDKNIIRRNRRIWNGLVCQNMDNANRTKIAEKMDLSVEELSPLSTNDEDFVVKKLARKFSLGKNVTIQDIHRKIRMEIESMKNIEVKNKLYMQKFVLNGINFENSIFHKGADFTKSYFGRGILRDTIFSGATFHDDVNFRKAIFNSAVYFRNTRFYSRSCFEKVNFHYDAIFEESEFGTDINTERLDTERHFSIKREGFQKENEFNGAIFHNIGDFSDSTFLYSTGFNGTEFHSNSIFRGVRFKGKSTFIDAKFERYVPEFHGAELHKGTVFTIDNEKKWPEPELDPEGGKNAYSCLRRLMREQYNPDEEHFFYRREMAWKTYHEGSWWHRWLVMKPYYWFSNYGYSVVRPLATFVAALALPALFFGVLDFLEYVGFRESDKISGGEVLKVSIANMLSLLGFERKYVLSTFEKEPSILIAVGGLQSVAAIVLVFLIGLALRTRFRLR